jgi:hypothetical protein
MLANNWPLYHITAISLGFWENSKGFYQLDYVVCRSKIWRITVSW